MINKKTQGKKNRYSIANKKRWANPEYKERVSINIGKSMKGNKNRLGLKHTEKTKERIRESEYHKNLKGTKKGILNPMYGTKMSEENKEKFNFKGRHHSKGTKEIQRISAIEYIKKVRGNISPNLGKNEKLVLDEIAKEIGYKIIRQYFVKGYFVDGYCKEGNIVFEVDERPKNNQRDIERENTIKQELNCTFVRIPTW